MKPPVKTRLVLGLCLFGLISVGAIFVFGFEPRSGGRDPRASIQVGKTETSTSLSTASTTDSVEDAGFSARHVLLYSDNPHPLNRRIVALIAQQLTNCPFIERLETADSPRVMTNGTASPDLFLNVNLVSLKQSGVLSSSMKTTVSASLGSAPWDSTYYSRDYSTPPLVLLAWNAGLDSDSTFTGVRSDRYADVAHSIAESLAKAIRKEIEDMAGKYPELPDLPADFYGPYRPVADFDFLKELHGRRVMSYCGLFTHNQTYWKFVTATNPVPQLQHIIGQLEAAGWKITDARLTNTLTPLVRGRQGDAELEIFHPHEVSMSFSADAPAAKPLEFVAHYRLPFSKPEHDAAMEELFSGNCPVDQLLPFQQLFSPAQRQKFFEMAVKMPATSPRVCIQLASVYLNRHQTNEAIAQLTRAKALASTIKDSTALNTDIESASRKISPRIPLKLEVTSDVCRGLGFLELTNLARSVELERALGQPFVLFGPAQHGIKICSLTVSAPLKDEYPWVVLQSEDGSHSWSSSSFALNGQEDWQTSLTFNGQTLKITATPQPDKKRVKFSVQAGG